MKRRFSGEVKSESAELKGFNIPRKPKNAYSSTRVWVNHGSMEEREILSDIQKTAINSAYNQLWKVRFVNLLHNPILEDSFCEKRGELKLQGNRSVVEELAFSVETVHDFEQVLQEGQCVKPCKYSLGNPEMGISLFRHVDVALRFAKYMECGSPVEVVVYKAVLGRPKMIHPRKCASDSFLDPTPNFDSHVSSIKPTNTDKTFDLLERSTVYLYEYDDDAIPASHPRHCIPIAVVSFNNFTMPFLISKLKTLLRSNNLYKLKNTENKIRHPNQSKPKDQSEVKKGIYSGVKKDTQRGVEKQKETQNEMKQDAQSEMKKDMSVKKATQSAVKKSAQSGVKKATQSEVKKVTQSGVQKDTQSKLKKDTQSEMKKDTQSEMKKDTQSEMKKDTQSEVKKATQNEVKKATQSRVQKATQSKLKKATQSEMKKDTQSEKKKHIQSEMKKDTQSKLMKDAQSEVKKDTHSEMKKDTQSEVKKDTQSETKKVTEVKKDTQSGVKKENQSGVKKGSQSGVKKDAQSEMNKENQSGAKKESQCGTKKESHSGTKKESHSGVKKDTLSVVKKDTLIVVKKDTQSGPNKESKSEVKKDPQIELKKEIRIVIKKEPTCLKKETLSSVKISSKSSKTSTRKNKGNKVKDISKTALSAHLKTENKKPLQQCDKKLDEESAITVSSMVNKTTVKTAVDIPSSGKSQNTNCDFFKRLLQQEFLRRKSELLKKLKNSEIELDEDSRLLLETNVTFSCKNEDSDISELSTGSESKLVELQDSTSVSDLVNTEKLDIPELSTGSESKSVELQDSTSVPDLVNTEKLHLPELSTDSESKSVALQDFTSVSDLVNTETLDIPELSTESENELELALQDSTPVSDVVITETLAQNKELETFIHSEKETVSAVKTVNCAQCEVDVEAAQTVIVITEVPDMKNRSGSCVLNGLPLKPTKDEQCAITEDIQSEENKEKLSLELNDNVVSQDPAQICVVAYSENNKKVAKVPNTDTCNKGEIVKVKLKNVSNISPVETANIDGCTKDRSTYTCPRESIPNLSSRNYPSTKEHKHRRKLSHDVHSSSNNQSWRMRLQQENKSHNSRQKKFSRTEARSKENNEGLSKSEKEKHFAKKLDDTEKVLTKKPQAAENISKLSPESVLDDTEKFITKKPQAAENISKLSPEAALNKLHDLLQQTGHCSIDFSTITDVLTGNVLRKVSESTAPKTADASTDCAQNEIKQQSILPVENHSNNSEQKGIAKEFVEDKVPQRVINMAGSATHITTEPPIQKPLLVDPRLEAATKPESHVTELSLHPSTIDTTVPPTALLSAFEKDKENHTSSLKRASDHDLSHKKNIKKPKLQPSKNSSSLPCPAGTAPRVKCNRPLTCPFYSLVSSTITWKVEKIELVEKPSISETDLTTKDDGKPKFNGRTLLKGGVEPRTIPLEIKDSILMKLVDPRRKKTSAKVEFRCQASVTSESGSCVSATSVDSGLADMDICGTTESSILDSDVVIGKQPIPTKGLDHVITRLTKLINDPKQTRPNPLEQVSSKEGLPEISLYPKTSPHNAVTTKVESVTPPNEEQLCSSIPEKLATDGFSSVPRTPTPPAEDSMAIYLGEDFNKNDFGFLNERSVKVSQGGYPVVNYFPTKHLLSDQTPTSSFPETFSKTAISLDNVQHFDQGLQNSLVSEFGNIVRNSQNSNLQNNVNCSYPNPSFTTPSVFNGFSPVFQPMAGECRAENYLAHSPFAFSNYPPLQPVNITPLAQTSFDARQRINELRCAKLISTQWTTLSQNCFNSMTGIKRPLSGASDDSNAKRFRSTIDFDDVLNRIKAAAVTRLPSFVP